MPAAAWYPDPSDTTVERWWDGQTWTSHVRPVQGAVVTVQPLPKDASSNPMTVTGLVLSCVSLLINPLLVISVLGVVFSAIGLGRANAAGAGKGAAITGLVIGIVATLASIGLKGATF